MNKKVNGRENDKVNCGASEDTLGCSVEVVEKVTKSEVALREEAMQAFWVEHDIFNKSLETPAGETPTGDFVFYDGPPFATGLPHYGHILAGTIKDAIPRFWTMNGLRVQRKWGWDCHGLPVENIIEKRLGLATKKDIEVYGVQKFNESAREAVTEYVADWQKIIPRMGRFADVGQGYKTMDSNYTESVWWVFKQLNEKGLVYEGFKGMHLCPRCGTTLSNFEVNQGYKDIKDIAVTVKLPLLDDDGKETDTSLLVWTTTPWTLPGNMAAAVHEDINYVKVQMTVSDSRSFMILAKGRLAQLDGFDYEVVEEFKGSDLVGKKYLPPFDYYSSPKSLFNLVRSDIDSDVWDNAWTIYHADYVELGEEGTGAVHIAPAYGDDDMKLAQEHKFPIVHHVDNTGHFVDVVTDFAGQLVKPKDDDEAGVDHKEADIKVLKALQADGKILKKENITHSYPHCWRCETPLLNYATTSWFVEVTKIKAELVVANQQVKWVPQNIGINRFGKWLEGARDWAVSRQRYWGAPLPIWRNPQTKDFKIFGSLAELQEFVPDQKNTFTIMRHGQSDSNVKEVISCNKANVDGLTELGKKQASEAVKNLPANIDIIIHSGFQRTKETAEIVAKNFPQAELIEDDRIRELDLTDDFEGGHWSSYNDKFSSWTNRYRETLPGSENRRDVQVRMGKFIEAINQQYKGKKILLVSHAGTLFALESAVKGWTPEEAEVVRDQSKMVYLTNAEVRELSYTPIPHNDNYELDFHRPYIDNFQLFEGEVELERVPDVFDCWFESGSMPYAQHHYPFSNKENFESEKFPAQFIAEGLDQTRGWFYSLIVLGTALFGKTPFENVIVNGTVLAEDGRKMSKSLQNYPDPMDVAHSAGADALRFYLLSSPAMKGEDLSFVEKEVLELQRKNIGRLHNVLAMYEMFADGTEARADSANILDGWIVARLNQLTAEVTAGYRKYELDKASRPITDFVDDLSVWYLRRSRGRLKGEDEADKVLALGTLRYVLHNLALVMAPVMPFYAEYLWQAVKEDSEAESVHLAAWPKGGEVNTALITEMNKTREIVTLALEARTKVNIKVRQPISGMEIFATEKLTADLLEVIQDEVNVKTITFSTSEGLEKVELDTILTPALLAEGAVRELMRAVQGKRKSEGLAQEDEISLTIATDEVGQSAIDTHRELLVGTVGAVELKFADTAEIQVEANEIKFAFAFKKV